jgi:hypothetical protein
VVVNGPNLYYFYIGVAILASTAIIVLAVFLLANYQLTTAIREQKFATMVSFQDEIHTLLHYISNDGKDNNERINYLMVLYEKVTKADEYNYLFRSIAQTTRSLIIPIGSFAISNYSTIASIV